jgi:Flp pilus assembly protein TadD
VLLKLGEQASAYQMLEHAHRLNPQDHAITDMLYTSTLGLAQKSRDDRQYSESIRYSQEAVELRPQEPAPHRLMAEIFARTGRTAQAESEAHKAEQLSSGSIAAPNH